MQFEKSLKSISLTITVCANYRYVHGKLREISRIALTNYVCCIHNTSG